MKTAAAGALLLALFALAQVVAAGVFAVLGPLALELEDELSQFIGLAVVGGLSVACALAFLKGSLRVATDQLQCRTGRRGG